MSKLTPAESDKGLQTHSFSHTDVAEQNWAWEVHVTSSLCLHLSKVKGPPSEGCVLRVISGLRQKVARTPSERWIQQWGLALTMRPISMSSGAGVNGPFTFPSFIEA